MGNVQSRLIRYLVVIGAIVAAAVVAVVVTGTHKHALAKPGEAGAGHAFPTITARPIPTPTTTVNPAKAPTFAPRGVYFGAYSQPPEYTQAADIAAVAELQSDFGRKLDIVHTYLRWSVPFPTASQQEFMDHGNILLLSWAGTDTRTITAGRDDAVIRRQALAIKAAGQPIFLEWRWEMNRPGLSSEVHSPASYIAAWDHIRAIFTQQHVDNVAWVWCPSSKGFGSGAPAYRNPAAFYPGNREVDWICVDAYPQDGVHASFSDLVKPFLNWATYIDKPVMIGEYGVPRSDGQHQRAQWLRGAAKTVRADPQIKAVLYYDGDPTGSPLHNYGLTSGSAPLAALRDMARQHYFDPRIPGQRR